MEKILITGATGQLGSLVIQELLRILSPEQIVATARKMDKAAFWQKQGIEVRQADYDRPETLKQALQGIQKVLLISSSELGKRVSQHQAVIQAAQQVGVSLLAYTSVLHADTSYLGLAEEHRLTETFIEQTGIPAVLLRNGWYTENYTANIPQVLQRGAVFGCARDGRIASATRLDYAQATAAILTSPDSQVGKVYELAGDESYTLGDLVAEISLQSGQTVVYQDMDQEDYARILIQAGFPPAIASMLAQSDAAAAQGALFDQSHTLSQLLGRPTTSWKESVRHVLDQTIAAGTP